MHRGHVTSRTDGAASSKVFDLPPGEVVTKLQACIGCAEAYREQFRATRDSLLHQPKGKQLEVNEHLVFSKLDLFLRRLEKLVEMFTTIEQFTTLVSLNVEG